MLKWIPNIITSCNLIFGCIAIIAIAEGTTDMIYPLVLAALLCDFLDGWLARMLNATSALGKQLDSLADLITFGVLPGYLFYTLLAPDAPGIDWLALLGLILTLGVALRLAKFNTDNRQEGQFLGLASPAAAMAVISYHYWVDQNFLNLGEHMNQPLLIYACILILFFLMQVEIPMFKLKLSRDQKNKVPQILFILGSISLFLWWYWAAMLPIVILYVFLSFGAWSFSETNKQV